MANPIDDPRYQLARMMRNQRQVGVGVPPLGPAKSQPSIQLGRTAANMANTMPLLHEQISRIAAGEPAAPKSALGKVLGNPVTRSALKGLEVFSLPGRAVTSTIGEIVDAFDNDPTTRASIADWGSRMKDPTTGFGKSARINTGNKWLDRTIGFIGDVALDPITYATFGVGKFAGYSGRLELAAKVLEQTGDEALSAAVARVGRSALRSQPEVLERVGANKFGVYMFGKRLKVGANGQGLRIPMTGAIGEIGESTLAKIRLGITDTRVGKYLQKVTMPKNMLEARIALAQGAGTPGQLADYVRFFHMVPEQRAATGRALQEFQTDVTNFLKQEQIGGGLDTYRKSVHRLIENPELLDSATDVERRGYEVWKNWFDGYKERIRAAFVSVDPEADIKMRENYFPHVMTDEAMAYTRANTSYGKDLRRVFMDDPFDLPDSFTPRALQPGKSFFGKLLTPEDMNIESLNKIANDGGFVGEFFETDVVNAAQKYVQDAAKEMGLVRRNEVLRDTGFFKKLEDARVTKLEVDEDAVSAARQHVEMVSNAVDGAGRDFRSSLRELVDSVRAEGAMVKASVAEQEQGVIKLMSYLDTASKGVETAEAAVRAARSRLAALVGDPGAVGLENLSESFPETLRPVLDQFDSISREFNTYKAAIDDATRKLGEEGYVAVNSVQLAQELEEKAKVAYQAYADAFDSIRSSMEFSNVIEQTWQRITDGGRVGGTSEAHEVIRDIRRILGLEPGTSGKTIAKARSEALDIEGALRDFVDADPQFQSLWKRLSGEAGAAAVKKENLKRMTTSAFDQTISVATSADTTVRALRESGLYALARDMRLFGGNIPDALRPYHDGLVQLLDDAAGLDAYYAVRRGRFGTGTIEQFDAAFGAAERQGRYLTSESKELASLRRTMDFLTSKNHVNGDDVVTLDILDSIFANRSTAITQKSAFLYDVVESGTDVTFDDLIDKIKIRQANIADELNQARFNSNGFKITSEDLAADTGKSYADIIKMRQDILSLEDARARVSRRVFEAGLDYDAVRQELAGALLKYQAISDVHVKFEAIANVLAPHGLVPSEEMMRGIMRTTYQQYGRQFSEKYSRLMYAEDAINNLRNTWSKEMQRVKTLPEADRPSLLRVFEDVYGQFMDSADGDILREVMGPYMNQLLDPETLNAQRRVYDSSARTAADAERAAGKEAGFDVKQMRYTSKQAKKKWERDYLIPWAKSIDPTLRADAAGPARKILKDWLTAAKASGKPSIISPLSPKSSEQNVAKWFGHFFDQMTDVDNAQFVVGGVAREVKDGYRITPGVVTRQRDSMMDVVRFFSGMNDGFVNPHDFFRGVMSDTPSVYAVMMQDHARRLVDLVGVEGMAGEVTNLSIAQARTKLSRTVPKSKLMAAAAEDDATRAERVLAAFQDPKVSSQELQNLGFTPEMMQKRDALLVLESFRRRAEYGVAKNDEEIIQFLRSASGVDMSKMDEGVVVRYDQRPVFEQTETSATAAANKAKLVSLNDDLKNIDEEIIARRREIINKYFSQVQTARMSAQDRQRLGVFATMSVDDPKHAAALDYVTRRAGAYRRQFLADMQGLESDIRNTYQSRRAVIQSRIDALGPAEGAAVEAAGQVGATQAAGRILRYENVPVFATMPDGSPLKFSDVEWDSLYRKPLTVKETRDVRAEIGRIESDINRLNAEKGRIMRRQPQRLGGSEIRAQILLKGRARLNEIEAEIASLRSSAQAQLRVLQVGDKNVQSAALEKVRILLQGHNGDTSRVLRADVFDGFHETLRRGREAETLATVAAHREEQLMKAAARDAESGAGNIFYSQELQRIGAPPKVSDVYAGSALDYYMKRSNAPVKLTDFMHPEQSDVRLLTLNKTWESSRSYKVLNNEKRLMRAAAGGAYGDARRSAKLLRRAAKQAQEIADTQRFQWDAVEKKVADAVVGMREAEVAAARAAGGTVEDAGVAQLRMFGFSEQDAVEQAVRSGTAVPYVLNGKQYVVPSFEEMFNNPGKYAARGVNKQTGRPSPLVGMFLDLRKPGNVALWKDMPEEVRATAGLYALNQVVQDWVPVAERAVKDLRGPAIAAKREAAAVRFEIRGGMQRMEEIRNLMNAWTKDTQTLGKALDDVRKALAVEAKSAEKELGKLSGEALRKRLDFFELGEEVRSLYGDIDAIPDIEMVDFVADVNSRIERLRSRQAQFEELLSTAPDAAAARALAGSKSPRAAQRWVGVYKDWIEENRATLAAMADFDIEADNYRVFESWSRAHEAESRFLREQARLGVAKGELTEAQAGVMVEKVVKPFQQGYSKAAKKYLEEQGLRTAGDFNMPSFGVSRESKAILSNLARIDDAATLRQVGAALGKYTSFFKAYATLTPGFHVRNGISNFFQMFAAGADVKNMMDGLSMYRKMGRALENGMTIEQWVASVPEAQRGAAKIASDVSLALGGGNVDDAFREFSTLKRNILTENIATRKSRQVGRSVEGSARFMLAYDTAVKGGDMVDSFNVTKRFLFDYNDPTILDDTVRHIIPFWTWMSRNLPLQIVNQWQNPKAYVVYNHLARNFGIGKNEVVPGYMKEQGAFKIGADTYLSPDLPFTKLNEQIAELSQPKRLASYLNPAIRLPIELAGNTKLYNNTEFRGNFVPAGGKYLPFVPLLSALGQIQYNEQGEPMMSDKAQYAITSLVPTFGQAERLFPATDVGDGAAGLRYLGIPIRKVNQETKDRELQRRLRQLLELQQQQKKVNE